LPGYKEPKPVVFVSFYPDDADKYDELKKSLERLKLNDASFTFEPDFNEVLGRGFKGGFLGKLHFEIISQRLEKEFGIKTITSFPSVAYKIKTKHPLKTFHGVSKPDEKGYAMILNPKDLPDDYEEILEPMIKVEIICPNSLLGQVLGLKEPFRWGQIETKMLLDKIIIETIMPLAELVSDFDDRLKSVSGGFASFSYENAGYKKNDLVRMDILVADEMVPGLSRIIPREGIEYEARKMAKLLKETLPGQQFPQAIQAKAMGRIIARETIPAMKKDVGNFGKNGGDRTRKMKLWKKQKEGKKKLLSMAKVRISAEDFKKLLSK
jgi:GTP-binding protein LepA